MSFGTSEEYEKLKVELVSRKGELSELHTKNQHVEITGDKISIVEGSMKGTMEGPQTLDDQFEMFRRKLAHKFAQLPDDTPNILIIQTHEFAMNYNDSLKETYIKEIEKVIARFKKISAVLIEYQFLEPSTKKAKMQRYSNSYSITSKSDVELLVQHLELIINPISSNPLNSNEIIELKRIFEKR